MKHLTQEHKVHHFSYVTKGFLAELYIAETIGKHKSVISREIKRNADKRTGEY